jgi:pyruvate,water dikinase
VENHNFYNYNGATAKKMRDEIESKINLDNEVKGQIACLGKVRGVVRVLYSSKEIGRVKRGEVLVTSMTTPDYVQAMEKASAFITDEGGLSCHAAIIAREMKKPCIIGTKIATKVLKDGDKVEVDANKGIVKIIKK